MAGRFVRLGLKDVTHDDGEFLDVILLNLSLAENQTTLFHSLIDHQLTTSALHVTHKANNAGTERITNWIIEI
jgi:hypothetical protein